MSHLSILIKPVSEKCNLDCDYCFYHDISNKRDIKDYGSMSKLTVNKIIEAAFLKKNVSKISFSFQGGEPTIRGVEFFEIFCLTVDKYKILFKNIEVEYFLQTNGTLLNQKFLKLFKKYDFLVGLSIDSRKEIHDKYRKYINGCNSFDKCMDALKCLKQYEIKFNVLTVVTRDIALDPYGLYEFLIDCDINYFQFIPCLDPINEKLGKKSWSLLPNDYSYFLDKFFNYWYNDFISGKKVISIRAFENYLGILKGVEPESCDMRGICSNQNVIEADGQVYPCDFYVFEQLSIGNIIHDTFDEIQDHPRLTSFIKNSRYLPQKCQNCKFLKLCKGGCSRNRYLDEGVVINYFCDSIYSFLDKNVEKLEIMKNYYD